MFTNSTSCGFAKDILHLTRLNGPYFKNNKDNRGLLGNPSNQQKLERYASFFLERKKEYEVDLRTFCNGMSKLKPMIIKLSKQKNSEKTFCFETFAPEVFMNMTDKQRCEHSLEKCQGCINNFTKGMESFSGVKAEKLIAMNNRYININIINKKTKPEKTAKDIIQSLNYTFNHTYKTSFTQTLTKLPESGLVSKPTYYETKQQKRPENRITK